MQLESRALTTLTIAGTLVAAATVQAQAGPGAALEQQIDRISRLASTSRLASAPHGGFRTAQPTRSSNGPRGRPRCRRSSDTRPRPERGASSCGRLGRLPLDVEDYAWSADGKKLLIFTNTERVWRQNTRGDYWVLNLQDGALKKLGGELRKAGAETSADVREVLARLALREEPPSKTAYVPRAKQRLYVERLDTGAHRPLTQDGSATTINGTSDWVYEEELNIRDGFRWSPDGRNIAYWQFDSTGVGIFSLIDDTTTLYPTITKIPYPKAGTTNSAVRIGVVSADGGQTTWMQMPGDSRQNYLSRLEWLDPRHGGDPASEPAAEPERFPPRRRRQAVP